jgi:diaminopimelate decarboxylase
MNPFAYQDRQLYAENVRLADIAADVGTPCYVYSRAAIEERFRAFDSALAARDHLVCYAVKANSNLAVLDLLARLGSGFDIVSGGELERVLAAGGDPARSCSPASARRPRRCAVRWRREFTVSTWNPRRSWKY